MKKFLCLCCVFSVWSVVGCRPVVVERQAPPPPIIVEEHPRPVIVEDHRRPPVVIAPRFGFGFGDHGDHGYHGHHH